MSTSPRPTLRLVSTQGRRPAPRPAPPPPLLPEAFLDDLHELARLRPAVIRVLENLVIDLLNDVADDGA